MKKFFSVVPLQQPGQLQRQQYEAVGNTKLQMARGTCFPILTAVNGYAAPGEEIRVIAVVQDTPSAWGNLDLMKEELSELCAETGIVCAGIEAVSVPNDERVSVCTDLFQKLIDFAEDEDELFACITFGTKPLSMTVNMAVQYAYRIKRNTVIGCFLYGKLDRDQHKSLVYDMTPLVQMDEIVHLLAEKKVADPKALIHALLSF